MKNIIENTAGRTAEGEIKNIIRRTVFALLLMCCISISAHAENTQYYDTAQEQTADIESEIGAKSETNIENEINSYNLEELEGYTEPENDYYTDGAGFADTVRNFASGKEVLNAANVLRAIVRGFFSEAYNCFSLLLSVLAISLLFSALNNIKGEFNSSSVGDTAFFVCYLIVTTLIANAFSDAASLVVSTVKSAAMFINAASPVMMTMLVTSGGISGAAAVNPVIMLCTELVTAVSEKFLMPLLYSAAALYIVSEINETIRVSKFADFLKKTVKWSLCLILTVFVGILSIQGFCTATLDSAAAKTAKFLVGTSIPVVGGILSDTVETVVGCSLVVKNATGAAGIVVLLIIASAPVIKILAVSASFHLCSAIIEPVADRRISSVMSSVASVTTLMAAIIVTAAVMFIISIGMIMCMSGAAL